MAYMYAEDHLKYGTKKDSFIFVAVNAHWEDHLYEIPALPREFSWKQAFDSTGYSAEPGKEKKLKEQTAVLVKARSTVVLLGV